jgi:hypothetical protein
MLLKKKPPTWTVTVSKASSLLDIYSTSSQMPVPSITLCVYRAFHGLEIQDKDFARMRPSERGQMEARDIDVKMTNPRKYRTTLLETDNTLPFADVWRQYHRRLHNNETTCARRQLRRR